MDKLGTVLLHLAIFIVAGTIHELAHAVAAYWLGDPTAKEEGRISLNPLRHVDPIGTVVLPVFLTLTSGLGFGWMKPVPCLPYNLRKPDRDMALISFAGPFSNFIQGCIGILILKVFSISDLNVWKVIWIYIQMNFVLMGFNLLPVFPLDGGGVLRFFLPQAWRERFDQFRHLGLLVLGLVIFTGVSDYWLRPFLSLAFAIFRLDVILIAAIIILCCIPVLILFKKRVSVESGARKMEKASRLEEKKEDRIVGENTRILKLADPVLEKKKSGSPLSTADKKWLNTLDAGEKEQGEQCSPMDFSLSDKFCLKCGLFKKCLLRYIDDASE